MKRKLLWMSMLMFITVSSFAQGITVKGVVSDAKTRETIPGVTVSVKGTNLQVAANVNGAYTINNLKPDAVLVFSYVGYKPEEIKVNGRAKIDVSLSPAYGDLNEVVVVGFGT